MTDEIEDGELNSDNEDDLNAKSSSKLNKNDLDTKLNIEEKNELNKLLTNGTNDSSESGELSNEEDEPLPSGSTTKNNPYDQEDVSFTFIIVHFDFCEKFVIFLNFFSSYRKLLYS